MDLRSTAETAASRYARIAQIRLEQRSRDMPDALRRNLVAVASSRQGRDYLNSAIEIAFRRTERKSRRKRAPIAAAEVVIGGGLHGAIYAAGRVKAGHPKPLVIERDTPGGPFRFSVDASFWTNSRNRPGLGGLPSENRALNVVPGAPVQIADISTTEYADNADWAFVIRVTHALYSKMMKGTVERVEANPNDSFRVLLADGREILTGRVLDARGLGDPRPTSEGAMTFKELIQRMDQPFPLADMKRVAIVGGGNSGLCAAEMLLGVAPRAGMSAPSLDWVEQVDLYSVNLPTFCDAWRSGVRGRYQSLGSFLRPVDNGIQRLRVVPELGTVTPTAEGTLVNGRQYDHVIEATGWRLRNDVVPFSRGRFVGTRPALAREDGERLGLFKIGVAADLPFEPYENGATAIPENRVALFRLGPRTSALAMTLPAAVAPEVPRPAPKPKRTVKAENDREFLANDRNGNPIYVGDVVDYSLGNASFFSGPARRRVGDKLEFLYKEYKSRVTVTRIVAGGPLVRALSSISKAVTPERVPAGKDRNGNRLFVGDRVRKVEGPLAPYEGTVEKNEYGGGLSVRLANREVRSDLPARYELMAIPSSKPNRLGVDKDGTPIYEGDLIRLDQQYSSPVEGKAVPYLGDTDRLSFAIMRTDGGEKGSGPNGAFRVFKTEQRLVVRFLAKDRNGVPIYAGDQVEFRLDENDTVPLNGAAIKAIGDDRLEFKYERFGKNVNNGRLETLVRQLDKIKKL